MSASMAIVCGQRRRTADALSFSLPRSLAESMGVSVSDTHIETMSATERVIANSLKRRPASPGISSSGMNTAMSEAVIEKTVKPISALPFKAACMGGSPSSTCRLMFSTTTIASSTTKPVEMMSAIIESASRLNPSRYMTPNVPTSEIGSARAGMSTVLRSRRNTYTTAITSITEKSSVRTVSFRLSWMVSERSIASVSFVPAGSSSLSCGMISLIRSIVLSMFAPMACVMDTDTEGTELKYPAE